MKAAIFDMDGTILDSMCVWDGLGADYLRSVGVEPPDDLWEIMRTLSFQETADYFIREFSLPHSAQEMMRIWEEYSAERYRSMAKLKPGAMEYLSLLDAAGVKICLATATDGEMAKEMLETHGVDRFFRFIITEADVGACKTAPDIYFEAVRRLGEEPADCVVIEDSLHAIETAKRAGFVVWGVYDESSADRQDKIRALCDRMIEFEAEAAKWKNAAELEGREDTQ